jgi:hypothetical protein
MRTQCSADDLTFQAQGGRTVTARFDGGRISSDGGALLVAQAERKYGLIRRFAGCFKDHRDPDLIEHSVEHLVAQRVYGLALGYEDLSDHDQLREDEVLAALVGKEDVTGAERVRARDRGKALAGKSTLNRLELTPAGATAADRYKKIVGDMKALASFWIDTYVWTHARRPDRIVIDLDATDDPIHGNQEGRFFHGYYDEYCYLPLYLFIDDCLVWAELRSSNIDGARGSAAALMEVLLRLWLEWPGVKVVVRGDSGFCREELMQLCEAWPGVDYVFGLAKNDRLLAMLAPQMAAAKAAYEGSGQPSRVFAELEYQTLKTWIRRRRVVGKAEHLSKGANPRFVVTSLKPEAYDAATLYERVYCARGEMENRIKEQQLDLFADRTSAATMRANQLRVWLSSLAYTLLEIVRREGLAGTKMEQAQCGTIRLRLLKIGTRVKVTARRVWLSLASAHPCQDVFRHAFRVLSVESMVAGNALSPPLTASS